MVERNGEIDKAWVRVQRRQLELTEGETTNVQANTIEISCSEITYQQIIEQETLIINNPSVNLETVIPEKGQVENFSLLSSDIKKVVEQTTRIVIEKESSDYLIGHMSTPDYRLGVVERLNRKGLLAREIAKETRYSLPTVYRLLSALYYEGRAIPQPEKIVSNKRYLDFVASVERLITRSADPTTKNEIASQLNSTPKAVDGAITVLRILGRLPYIDRSILERRKAGTDNNLLKIHVALIQFQQLNPCRQITLRELRDLSGVDLSDKSLSKYHNEILEQDPSLPHTKVGAYDRAKKMILEYIKNNPNQSPNFMKLQRESGINHNTFSRAYRSVLQGVK